mmetsp:Transcript_45166/g.139342  ORF Transcript_45166/g.139342 Transcript_45166/m.139342 type:complete len:236 (-) Transcript_45166:220-927(-)
MSMLDGQGGSRRSGVTTHWRHTSTSAYLCIGVAESGGRRRNFQQPLNKQDARKLGELRTRQFWGGVPAITAPPAPRCRRHVPTTRHPGVGAQGRRCARARGGPRRARRANRPSPRTSCAGAPACAARPSHGGAAGDDSRRRRALQVPLGEGRQRGAAQARGAGVVVGGRRERSSREQAAARVRRRRREDDEIAVGVAGIVVGATVIDGVTSPFGVATGNAKLHGRFGEARGIRRL